MAHDLSSYSMIARKVDGLLKRVRNGIRGMAITLRDGYRRALSVRNPLGYFPSPAGQPPRSVTGRGVKSIAYWIHDFLPYAAVGARKEGQHLAILEDLSRPHIIRPRFAKLLRFPWRPKGGFGFREPTQDEIKTLRLVRGTFMVGGRRYAGWVMYRPYVLHPGVLPRRWLWPTLVQRRAAMEAAFRAAGGRI